MNDIKNRLPFARLVPVCAMALASALLAAPLTGAAQESKAKGWGLNEEAPTVLSGTVVDLLCELGGDCPDNCGDGGRLLGLSTDDGKLVAVSKNGQPAFNGAITDLLPYCGKKVDTDGLMTGFGANRFYQVQLIREQGSDKWNKATLWTGVRAKSEPALLEGKGPWFRRDPRVLDRIERDGYLGLGKEADEKFIAEW